MVEAQTGAHGQTCRLSPRDSYAPDVAPDVGRDHEVREAPVRSGEEHSGDAELVSPMPGSVVAVGVIDGAAVASGDVVVTVEAMKMEHALSSPVDGVVELLVAVGDQVKVGQPLARITAAIKETQS